MKSLAVTNKCIGAILLVGSIAPAAAADNVELYGIIDSGVQYLGTRKHLSDKTTVRNTVSVKSGVYKGSRWGIKGSEGLGSGYSVNFVLESGFSSDDGKQAFSRLFGRQSTISLAGPFGELMLGRMGALASGAGPFALAGWFSPFGTSCGDYSVTANNYMFGFKRFDNTFAYKTPTFQNWQLFLQYSRDTDTLEDIDPVTEGVQHGKEGRSNTSHYYGVGTRFKDKTKEFSVMFERLSYARQVSGFRPTSATSVTLGGSYLLSGWQLFTGLQYFRNGTSKLMKSIDKVWGDKGYKDGESIVGGLNIPALNGSVLVAMGYSHYKPSRGAANGQTKGYRYGGSIGYLYPVSKRTTLYALLNYARDVQRYRTEHMNKDKSSTIESSIGIAHSF